MTNNSFLNKTINKGQCASIEDGLPMEIGNADVVSAVNNPLTTEEQQKVFKPRRGRLTLDYLDKFKYMFEPKKAQSKADDVEEAYLGYPEALPEEFYNMLPQFLKTLPMEHMDNPHLRDAALLGMWPVVATMMPHLEVKHDNEDRTCALYVFVAGAPTAGKSSVTGNQVILEMINAELLAVREEELRKYNIKRKAYEIKRKVIENEGKKKSQEEVEQELMALVEPQQPLLPYLFVAPRTTEARFLHDLMEAHGLNMLLVLSEVAVLLNSNKREHGNYVEELLDIYDNKGIEKRLRTNNEEIRIDRPSLSAIFTGVPEQLGKFFSQFPNGMESRVSTMLLVKDSAYKPEDTAEYEKHQALVKQLQEVAYGLYMWLRGAGDGGAKFMLDIPEKDMEHIDTFFAAKEELVAGAYLSKDAKSLVRRKKLDFKRITAMLEVLLRYEQSGSWDEVFASHTIVPSRTTINLALFYANHLIDHSLYVQSRYGSLRHKEEEPQKLLDRKELLALLDKTFLSSEAKELLERNGDTNPYRTIRAWREGCFIEQIGKAGKVSTYRKLSPTEQNKRLKMSVRAKNKRQRSVNKRSKRK